MSPGWRNASPNTEVKRGGDVLHGAAHHRGELEERLRVEAGVEERLRIARQLELLLRDRTLARLAHRHAERAGSLVGEVGVEARLLRELLARVELSLAGEHALDRQQRQPVLRGRLAQLLEAEALLLEALQQLEPSTRGRSPRRAGPRLRSRSPRAHRALRSRRWVSDTTCHGPSAASADGVAPRPARGLCRGARRDRAFLRRDRGGVPQRHPLLRHRHQRRAGRRGSRGAHRCRRQARGRAARC